MRKIIIQDERLDLNLPQIKRGVEQRVTDRELLVPRTKKYIDLIGKLDAETLVDTKGKEEFVKEIQAELNKVGLQNLPLGILSRCYLGHPYEVHTFDIGITEVVQHFKKGEAMDPIFERFRNLALHNAYLFIEVYTDKVVLVNSDGGTSIL